MLIIEIRMEIYFDSAPVNWLLITGVSVLYHRGVVSSTIGSQSWGMWPYYMHLQLHLHYWLLDQLKNRIIQLATLNDLDHHFEFQDRNWDAEVVRGQSGDSFSLQVITYVFPIVLSIELGTSNTYWAYSPISTVNR